MYGSTTTYVLFAAHAGWHRGTWHARGFSLACCARTTQSDHVEDCCARGTRRSICMKPRWCPHGVQVLRTAISVVQDVEGAFSDTAPSSPKAQRQRAPLHVTSRGQRCHPCFCTCIMLAQLGPAWLVGDRKWSTQPVDDEASRRAYEPQERDEMCQVMAVVR